MAGPLASSKQRADGPKQHHTGNISLLRDRQGLLGANLRQRRRNTVTLRGILGSESRGVVGFWD